MCRVFRLNSACEESVSLVKPRSHLAEYFCDCLRGDNWAIANNLKPIGTVIISVENKSVSSIYYFEPFAYFSETVLNLSNLFPAILLRSQSVHGMFRNGPDESSHNRKHIRTYSDK